MRISCRHCGEPYDIDERSLPRFGASVRCPACGGLFELPSRSAQAARRFEPLAMVPGPAPFAPAADTASAEEAAESILPAEGTPSGRDVDVLPENGRSAEAEHRAALEQVFGGDSKEEGFRRADALRASILARRNGQPLSSSFDLIREDRETR